MSVYTTVTSQALATFLQSYQLGDVIHLQGIRDGIENTNYFLTTTNGNYVLTVFETLEFDDVPYCMELMHYFSSHGVACADPQADNTGRYVNLLMGKPASIVSKLTGSSVATASAQQISEIGRVLGIMHRTSLDFISHRDCRFDCQWRNMAAQSVMKNLPFDEQHLLQAEMDIQSHHTFSELPNGVIHSDLFRDNALFVDDRLTGVIDFYDACNGPFLYDLAVVVNDWCRYEDGAIDRFKTLELLKAYNTQRQLNVLEHGAWPIMLRRAALRFWLSRLQSKYNPRTGQLAFQKNPKEFQNILIKTIEQGAILRNLWLS